MNKKSAKNSINSSAKIYSFTHRGPDEEGIYVEGQIGLGHRRLSIIDIAGGHQPMKSHARNGASQVIVYNGEIYNYVALRRELESLGHTFRTGSDTEVLLTSYGEWDQKCVHRLRGMFAFAIWDEAKNALFLARDRMGIKPLYYYLGRQAFVFASKVRAILASNTRRTRKIGPGRLFDAWLHAVPQNHIQRHCETPARTCYDREHEWKRGDAGLRNFSRIAPSTLTFADAGERLRELLWESVQMRLMSEVPLGAFLSGGLDRHHSDHVPGKRARSEDLFRGLRGR